MQFMKAEHMENNNYSKYQCPKCGMYSSEEGCIHKTDAEYDEEKTVEFGVEFLSWIETHKCIGCGMEYKFGNFNV